MIGEDRFRIAGLLLAAGRARRMGVLKQTLPWPPRSQQSQSEVSNLKPQIPQSTTLR